MSLLSLYGLHHLPGLSDSLAGLLDGIVPVPDSGLGSFDGGFEGFGGLLGHEAGNTPGGLPDQA
jgi:hypothetical protein